MNNDPGRSRKVGRLSGGYQNSHNGLGMGDPWWFGDKGHYGYGDDVVVALLEFVSWRVLRLLLLLCDIVEVIMSCVDGCAWMMQVQASVYV